jgi:hypothetical protein
MLKNLKKKTMYKKIVGLYIYIFVVLKLKLKCTCIYITSILHLKSRSKKKNTNTLSKTIINPLPKKQRRKQIINGSNTLICF